MSDTELDVAKHEIGIYEKEVAEAIQKHDEFLQRLQSQLSEDPQASLAIIIANFSEKMNLIDRLVEMQTKLIKAYKTYIQLLERDIGK